MIWITGMQLTWFKSHPWSRLNRSLLLQSNSYAVSRFWPSGWGEYIPQGWALGLKGRRRVSICQQTPQFVSHRGFAQPMVDVSLSLGRDGIRHPNIYGSKESLVPPNA